MAVDFVGIQSVQHHLNRTFQLNNHDFTVSSDFKQAVNVFKRSGHARFRRGPPVSSSDPQAPSVSSRSEEKVLNIVTDATPSFQSPTSASNDCGLKNIVTDATASFLYPTFEYNDCVLKNIVTDTTATVSFQSAVSASKECGLNKSVTDATATASFQSATCSFAGGSVEGSVSNGRQVSSLGIVAPAPSFSSRKPPLPSSHRKRLSTEMNHSVSGTGCHCCKRRKTVSKRKVRRIPIIGSKVESIPADDYSWKKYGEKKVTGSPFPRVYYKCNSVEGCPARKRVELSVTDSKMLIVTYDREHRH